MYENVDREVPEVKLIWSLPAEIANISVRLWQLKITGENIMIETQCIKNQKEASIFKKSIIPSETRMSNITRGKQKDLPFWKVGVGSI